MCASCVTLHTEEHREKGTHGHYLSYEAARNEIHNNYGNGIIQFEELSKDYAQDY